MLGWNAFRESLRTALLEAVSGQPGGPWRVAALDEMYAESGGVITAPTLFLNDDSGDTTPPVEWGCAIDEWAPEPLIEALNAEACSGTVVHWNDVFAHYQDILVQICVAAGAHLGIPVYYVDVDRYEETLARCLSPAQLRSLFPEVVAVQTERARVSALRRLFRRDRPEMRSTCKYLPKLSGAKPIFRLPDASLVT